MKLAFVEKDRAEEIARLAVCLMEEVNERTGRTPVTANLQQVARLCKNFLAKGQYSVIAAFDEDRIVGFGALCESHSLYAEGSFGILQELYILPEYRSRKIGAMLLEKIYALARKKGWKRIELATPPLPEFERTVGFYRNNGFEVTGGHKMKRIIEG
ncbi:MAG: GNAT family N-acetyltransferase [Gammaproteobacteria bacterium RIFCSPLOWO2_02_FULL_56_15]|nr:MAG: GNAT family N-acetyltransferase [Gammaproteobacteria bacterium RIFCSPLOWO2_02_FULL_56_15]